MSCRVAPTNRKLLARIVAFTPHGPWPTRCETIARIANSYDHPL
jgi:hypothetical protein